MIYSPNCTEAENAIIGLVLAIPNVSSRVLRIALRRVRILEGRCATYNCTSMHLPNLTLCQRCHEVNTKARLKFRKKQAEE